MTNQQVQRQETQLSLTNRATRLERPSKNTMTLKPGLGSLKFIGNVTIRYSACDLLLMFNSNSSVVSEIFNVKNVVTLKSGSEVTQGH